ncbi:hypothetical protein [Rubellimicrobium thermophilum]|uniref:hypothetical protein n=1 Tax=Rubellimicrobium thermophilum TaxID=295419 RepID=UPI001FDFA529|nr:hypothetical protein [Rubellimicrobium thermophilum]
MTGWSLPISRRPARLQVETRAGFEVDGIEVRARLDFGAGWVDWRSWVRNPGAAS